MTLMERLPFQKFRHHKKRARIGTDVENRNDVWMVEPGEGLRFLLETTQSLRILGEVSRQNFDCHVAVEFGVMSTIHDPHSALADKRADLVTPESRADINTHYFVFPGDCSVVLNDCRDQQVVKNYRAV